ncbi:MAG: hypothetical protein DRP73_02470 [Candidatus Omnitrophota bacterium]|nr:MAG: hypothetical protein DRP73_02470 [Candidatus Omnitrophota bacterium]
MRECGILRDWKYGGSMELVNRIYEITQDFSIQERYSLINQMIRAGISPPANIAEGCSRDSHNDFYRNIGKMLSGLINSIDT